MNIDSEKTNIENKKVNIEEDFTAKTASHVRKLQEALGKEIVFGRSDVQRVLLDDVYSIGEASGRTKNYCLQPIVVRRKAEDEFELIDGQQRLTTLFLIYKYMHAAAGAFIKDAKFTLSYDTREKSAEFLENINPDLKTTI